MTKLTQSEANAPKPKPPQGIKGQDWLNYYEDLACWKATQAERLLVGVEESR